MPDPTPATTEPDDLINRLRTLDVDLEPSHCAEVMHMAAEEIEHLRVWKLEAADQIVLLTREIVRLQP